MQLFSFRCKYIYKQEENSEYKCSICEKVFASAPGLSRHKRLHSGLTKQCPICSNEIPCSRQDNYTRHVERCEKKKAKEPKSYKCIRCNASFKTKQHYERHCKTKTL